MNQGVSVRVIFGCCLSFWICSTFFPTVVFGSSDLNSDSDSVLAPDQFKILSPSEHFEGLAKYFKAFEDQNGELKKSHEELKEHFKLLRQEMDKMKQGMKEDDGLWLLTPPLRGPPGKQGETGTKGDRGPSGPPGPKGETGENGQVGPSPPPAAQRPKPDEPVQNPQSVKSCSDAMKPPISASYRPRKQAIYPHGNNKTSLDVLCDFETDGGGWTLIQKRTSGPKQEFNRTWTEYSNGFGSLDKNFWIGLENIHALTQKGDQELRIELEDFEGNKRYAKYSSFSVSAASDFYRLSISGYSVNSTLGNDMISSTYSTRVHNGMRFSTPDKDNDAGYNCAVNHPGGWWFNNCHTANLNGLYFEKGETVPNSKGINWYSWKGYEYSLAKTEMKIRNKM